MIGFYDASMGFSKKWMIFTVNSYYDSNGNGIRYSDIGKADTVIDKPCVSVRNKKGQLLGTYHVPADKYEVYSLLNRAGNFDSKMIWERGKELEKSGKTEQAFLLYLEAAIHWNNHNAMNDVGVCYGLGKYVKKDAESGTLD